ncbi:MAG: long-chain fatty acid--CoA ligase [Anaerolineales bacterium]|nr:long-chain fatty acid--CoA ligase [Chloroflexota bacterium]MBL6983299.1 long-chain fatty acid--CoA ligase [Anaerolineales bacterium]
MSDRPWLERYDEGVPQTIDYPEVPLFYFLEEGAKKYPDAPCTIFKGAKISYSEMVDRTDRFAAALASLGVKKGDRVGIFIPNTPQFVVAYFGALKVGAVVVATNPLYTAREIEHQANDSGMELMIVMSNFYNTVKEVQPKTKIKQIVVTNIKETLPPATAFLFTLLKEKKAGFRVELSEGDIWWEDLIADFKPEDRPNVDVGPDDVAIFQYSGGTTGTPKGAIALHRNLVANSLQIRRWMPQAIDGEEVVLMAIPLYHVYGMVAGMNFGMATGAALVMIPNARDIKDDLDNLQKYKCTIFPGVPTLYNAINNWPDVLAGKYDLSSIKACISGSAALMRETKEAFEELTGGVVFEGFGLSEAPTATHCNPLIGDNRVGSIGMPLSDVDARIVSLDDEVTVLPVGEIGELVIQGPQVFKGYHNMPTETKNTLRDGWLYTGDIARMDEDGYFYIVDRKKEVIKPGGFQVWPREVEEIIADNPKVLEVGVAGIPDPKRGETVKAWVVVKPGETLTGEEVREFCKDKMAAYKVPTHVEFRDELPKTTVGKILRRELVREHKETM